MHYQSPNCSFFDWQRAIKLILHLACLVNINCSSLQLIKKGPTVYHMCPTLITFTNHTTPPPPNPIVTLRTCVWGLAISTYLTHTTTYYALAPNRMIFFLFQYKDNTHTHTHSFSCFLASYYSLLWLIAMQSLGATCFTLTFPCYTTMYS